MATTSTQPASRYRRRIVGLGALATGALYVIGAPIFNDRIETDLESRVPAELAAIGFAGLTASFSGQDGTLNCIAPLDDPEAARAAAFAVRGVRTVELDRSCRVNTSAALTDEDSLTETSADRPDRDEVSADVAVSAAPATESSEPAGTNPETELATIHDVVAANPDLAFLSVLIADTEIGSAEQLTTLFAPSNSAFDAVPADVLSRLQNDSALLGEVLDHHVVEGALMSSDLVDGELVAGDGTPLTVVAGDEIAVGGAVLTETDIVASNGVVHVIDAVLVPPGLLDEPGAEAAPVAVSYDGVQIVLKGVVASEVERQVLVEAAVDSVGVDFVVDEMTVEPDIGVDQAIATDISALVLPMSLNLSNGEVGFDGAGTYATGVALSVASGEAFAAAAAEVSIDVGLVAVPEPTGPRDASEEDAADLETQLNEFVADNPILFEPSSEVLAESAFLLIDQVAADLLAFNGLLVTVEGHTDSDGIAIENLQLSQDRADVVREALIERGLSAGAVAAEGFGSDRPVLVGGSEDKSASRRVEFRVVLAP